MSNVPSDVLLPSNCWADKENYTKTLSHLAELFVKVLWVLCVWRVGLALRVAARLSSSFLPGSCLSFADQLMSAWFLSCEQNFKKFEDGGGHVTADEAHRILAAGPRV